MLLVRTIMAVMIALSVAMLPVAGSAASIANATQDAADLMWGAAEAMSMEMAMSGTMYAMDECCPDHMKAKPCEQPTHQCPVGCCTASPTSLASAGVLRFDVPMAAGQPLPIPVDQVVALHSGSPPFRPPRV